MLKPTHHDDPTNAMNSIGVDIGGTKIAFALVDPAGNVLKEARLPTPAAAGLPAVLQQIMDGIAALSAPPDTAVGVGSPGYINDGTVIYAANLNWHNIPLARLLTDRLNRRVVLENDARAALMGERMYGAARSHPHAVYLSVGTGLGMAALVDGRLLRGVRGVSMEVGHIRRDDGATFESGASGTGLTHIAGTLRHEYTTALPSTATTADILQAQARGDDALAAAALRVWLDNITQAAVWVSSVLNPDALIIGGGMGLAAFAAIQAACTEALTARCSPLVAESVTILPAQVASSAVGAAALAR